MGHIVISADYFMFISFGQHNPRDKVFVSGSHENDYREIKKLKIYKWKEIEEVIRKKYKNL